MIEWYWVLAAILYAAISVYLLIDYNEYEKRFEKISWLLVAVLWPVMLPVLLPFYGVVFLWRLIVFCPERARDSLREKRQMEAFREWINRQEGGVK